MQQTTSAVLQPLASPVTIYLMKQVLRSPGDSHVINIDLGIYSSEEELKRAAKQFVDAHPAHPDTPYNIYAWPCVLDRAAFDFEHDAKTGQEKGFYVIC